MENLKMQVLQELDKNPSLRQVVYYFDFGGGGDFMIKRGIGDCTIITRDNLNRKEKQKLNDIAIELREQLPKINANYFLIYKKV